LRPSIPTFYLYGEPQKAVDDGFVHVENLHDRSRPSEWTIQPHRHLDLSHVILIATGGGVMDAETGEVEFEAPCLLFVPSGIVHGFRWHRESSGSVITLARTWLDAILGRDPALPRLFAKPCAVRVNAQDRVEIEAHVASMSRELNWTAPGRVAAIEAGLLAILVRALRRSEREAGAVPAVMRHHPALVARLREQIEQRFRLREPIAEHARKLGVSETTLRHACARVTGIAPAAMLDERTMLEARRMLIYSDLSVAEIGYGLGFEDPAYFSRFFRRHAGSSPRMWRARRGASERR
jgi:AraC family transcriptional activator of pobA